MPIRIDTSGVFLDGRYLPLLSGTVHYWRHSPESWKTILEKVRAIGFDVIMVDVPWGVHETGPAMFDFGSRQASKNLPVFLDLCKEAELYVIIRPGPLHNIELPCAGLPLRIAKNSIYWALTTDGSPALVDGFPQPYPMPSLLNEKLYFEFSKFLDALLLHLSPRQYPEGPVILFQAGSTISDFGRNRSSDIDYSQHALLAYSRYLSDKYHSLDALNSLYGTKYDSFSAVVPPKKFHASSFKDLSWYLDWISFKEFVNLESVRKIVPQLRDRGITVPLFHTADEITSPANHHSLQESSEIQCVAINMLKPNTRFEDFINRVRYLSGAHRLAFAADIRDGAAWNSVCLPTPDEQEFQFLTAIMFGASAVNLHMLVDRDRWTGAPITIDGRLREEYADLHKRLHDFVTGHHIFEGKKSARTLILLHHEIERLRCAVSSFGPAYLGLLQYPRQITGQDLHLGFSNDPLQLSILNENQNWLLDLIHLLEARQIEFNFADTNVSLDLLSKYDMVFLPVADFISQLVFEKLMDFSQRGGHLVFGPGQPYLNEHFKPLSTSKVALGQVIFRYEKMDSPGTASLGLGKITWQPDVSAIEQAFVPDIQNRILHDNPALRLTIREGQSSLVFLSNPTKQRQAANIVSTHALRGVWNLPDAVFEGNIQTELAPLSIQVFEVIT